MVGSRTVRQPPPLGPQLPRRVEKITVSPPHSTHEVPAHSCRLCRCAYTCVDVVQEGAVVLEAVVGGLAIARSTPSMLIPSRFSRKVLQAGAGIESTFVFRGREERPAKRSAARGTTVCCH